MQINFKIDGDRYLDTVTWDLQIAMEDGAMNHKQSKQLCACFLVNEAGEYYPVEEANRILGGLTMRQVNDAALSLYEQIKRMGDNQTPLAPGAASLQPSSMVPLSR